MTNETLADCHTTAARPTVQLQSAAFDNGWRGRFNAWFFQVFDRYIAHVTRRLKDAAFGDIEAGTIVEIGPGVGANFDYIPRGSRLIAMEPNLPMHGPLRERAEERGIDLEIHAGGAESIPLADGSVDDVLCSLVLCTVDDPTVVLQEIRRVLRPGGRFRFVEHVAAPSSSPRRLLQRVIRRPWLWLFEGCDVCRDTGRTVESAGFASVDQHEALMRHSVFVPVNSALRGIATNGGHGHDGC